MNENKNFDSLIWKIVWKMKKIIHMLANEFLLLQAAWSNTMTYLAVAVILSCPYIFQVDCSRMVSKNFFSICSSECMLVPGQTEFKCETAVTADTCDPLAGVNQGRVASLPPIRTPWLHLWNIDAPNLSSLFHIKNYFNFR